MIARLLLAAFLVSLVPAVAGADQELLASAKTLYESASYEAALTELSAIDSKDHVDVVDTYRALCLLGLGRTRDAEQALTLIVARQPMLVLSEAEYSPRIVSLFRDVRKRALPLAAQQLYATAKSDFENKNYEAAAANFRLTLQVIADVDAEDQTSTLADLKQLADGFLMLAEAKAAPPPPPTPAPAPKPPVAAPVVPAPVQYYTLLDTAVTPPVVIDQRLPPWRFPPGPRVLTGRLELTIDETGAVESVALSQSIWPGYDAILVPAAWKWRYQPAMRGGKPVKFRRVLDINVDPSIPVSR